jgi:hypothetical protein
VYGAETFVLRKLDEIYLEVFKMWLLEKNGQNQLDRSRGKRSITKSEGGE